MHAFDAAVASAVRHALVAFPAPSPCHRGGWSAREARIIYRVELATRLRMIYRPLRVRMGGD